MNLFVLRDDLLHPFLNGNKARKLFYFLDKNLDDISTIVSYGGNQSNMLYALSYFCFIKQKKFIYYTTNIPINLTKNPIGNFKFALELNTHFRELDKLDFDIQISQVKQNINKNQLFISQGGADIYSKYGIKKLSLDIKKYIKDNNLSNISIFLPSGTGTSALYLQQYLENTIYTTPCIGDEKYLLEQFELLKIKDKDIQKYPIILNTNKKYHFGKCYKEFYDKYLYFLSHKIEFELLYDMKSLLAIEENIDQLSSNILYIHSGGVYGNNSMKLRYAYKGIKN
jgi:1-aminocyclopropane-1-carboxylate deaminase/D-cysteine desulfhydrase-like pyridoxal-dependent ACC family enzyme